MVVVLLTLLFTGLAKASASSLLTIKNDALALSFDSETSALSSLVDMSSGVDMVFTEDTSALASVPIWTIQMADVDGLVTVTSARRPISLHSLTTTSLQQKLSLSWTDVALYDSPSSSLAYINVTMEVTLPNDSAFSSWSLGVQTQPNSASSSSVGMWEAIISVPLSAGGGSDGELFFPSGYGETYYDPTESTGGSVSGLYPSGGVAMQFMAVAGSSSSASSSGREVTSGVYVATPDSTGGIKGFEYATLAYALAAPAPRPRAQAHAHAARASLTRERDLPPAAQRKQQQQQQQQQGNSPRLSLLRVTVFAEDAGKELPPGGSWRAPFPVTVGLVRNISAAEGRPLWSEAARIYRSWALREAPWTGQTLAQRATLPAWYRSNSLWLNTHWQCHDIFNVTGGEPAVVHEAVSQLATLLDIPSIALHWYEWQQGPDPAPSARYKFDTHYPDYFPPRQPQLFREVVRGLRDDFGVHTVPYINGRIFDIGSDTYLADDGAKYCSQYVVSPKLRSKSATENRANLAPYLENYGNEATFCVASPFTPYWQEIITSTVAELTNDWAVDGVYIDQIGEATPRVCYDPVHGHTLGGGTYWTSGYEQMLTSIHRAMRPYQDGSLPPIVTENNAEVYMGLLQGYLTLTAFKKSLAQSPAAAGAGAGRVTDYPHLSPAFATVYGGYYVGFGAEWFLTDFSDPDWFCGKLSSMLMSGAQLGWFSLLSIVDDPTDSCGDMGVGGAFLDPANSDMVDFVRLLSRERAKAVSYVVDGHLARPVVLRPPAEIRKQNVPSKNMPVLDYDAVSSSAWQLEERGVVSTLIMLAGNVKAFAYSGEIVVDFSNYGYEGVARLSLEVLSDEAGKTAPGASVTSATLHGPVATVAVTVQPRSVVLLVLTPA